MYEIIHVRSVYSLYNNPRLWTVNIPENIMAACQAGRHLVPFFNGL